MIIGKVNCVIQSHVANIYALYRHAEIDNLAVGISASHFTNVQGKTTV